MAYQYDQAPHYRHNQYSTQYDMGHQQQHYNDSYGHRQTDEYGYDAGPSQHDADSVEDSGGGGMAGVGARRLAERQEARRRKAEMLERQEEERRWQAAEEERRYYEEQERQHWEQEEQRRRRYAEDEEQRRRQLAEEEEERQLHAEQQQYERENAQRQQEWYEHDQRLRQKEEQERWQRGQEQTLHQTSYHRSNYDAYGASKGHHTPASSSHYASDDLRPQSVEEWDVQRTQSSRRGQTDSQATARPQYNGRLSGSAAISDGFDRLAPPNHASLRPPSSADVRATVYDDDYEEPEALRAHSDVEYARQSLQGRPRSSSQRSAVSDGLNGIIRETVYEALPKATCADCGEQLPFDDLVHHVCVRYACQSPLLTTGPGSLSSRAASPLPSNSTPPANEQASRLPFFDRYDRTLEGGLLSPALPPSSRSSPSPRMAKEALSAASASPRSMTSPLMGTGTEQLTAEEERLRLERKRRIEAQRAAKKQALMVKTTPRSVTDAPRSASPTSASSLSPLDHVMPNLSISKETRSHRRAPDSLSSMSTASSKSSTSSFFVKPASGTITPSSSNEQVSNAGNVALASQLRAKKPSEQVSPSRRPLDLKGIEGLVREIENAPATPPRTTKRSATKESASRPTPQKKDTLEAPKEHTSRSRRPSTSSTASSRTTERKQSGNVAPPSAPLMTRTRTKDQVKNKLCSVCLKAFERGQPMVQRDGKVFCLDDYAELYLEKCRKCQQAVRTVGVRSRDGALSGLFHRECFSCLQCDATFHDGTFYVFDNAPYCAQHYHKLNGTVCGACRTGIEGQCRQLTETGERFHMRCLTCQFDDGREFCKDLLHDYFLYKGKRLCEWHFGKVMQMQTRKANDRGARGQRRNITNDDPSAAMAAAEIRAARRTTYLHTVAAKKGRA